MNKKSAATQSPTQRKRERTWQTTSSQGRSHRPASKSSAILTPTRSMPHSVEAKTSIKPTPGRRRSEASHQAILKAASELLEEVGYVGMSIEAIARRAGVGKQTIYRWWPSKAHVVLEFYSGLVKQALSDPDTGAVQADLVQWVEQLVNLLTTSASTQALAGILAEVQANPGLAQQFGEQIISYRRRCIHAILQRGVKRGELRDDLNVELAADLIDAPVWYRLLLGSASLNLQWAEQLVDEVLLGLQAFEEEA